MINVLLTLPEFGYDIFIELLGATIVFFAGIFFGVFRDRLYKQRVHNATRLTINSKDENTFFRCYYANSGLVDSEEATGIGYHFEYMSHANMVNYLLSINKNVEIDSKIGPLFVKDIGKYHLTSNVIIYGGPFHNLITGLVFGLTKEYHNVPFYFDYYGEEAAALYHVGDEQKPYVPSMNPDKTYYSNDYGIIINVVNPYNTKKRIIAFIGCRSIGVYGASFYFTNSAKELKKRTKGMENYVAIVKCGGDEDNITGDVILKNVYEIDEIDETKITNAHLKDIKRATSKQKKLKKNNNE